MTVEVLRYAALARFLPETPSRLHGETLSSLAVSWRT
jgi:hypothetical protein